MENKAPNGQGQELPFIPGKVAEAYLVVDEQKKKKIEEIKNEHDIALPVELGTDGQYYVVKENGSRQLVDEWIALQDVYNDTKDERRDNWKKGNN